VTISIPIRIQLEFEDRFKRKIPCIHCTSAVVFSDSGEAGNSVVSFVVRRVLCAPFPAKSCRKYRKVVDEKLLKTKLNHYI
jgi:hypothetical protein